MKRMQALVCVVGMSALFGTGCGGPMEEAEPPSNELPSVETPSESGDKRAMVVFSVCWSALGVYSAPHTYSPLNTTLHAGSGNNFDVVSGPFVSDGAWWAFGYTTMGGTPGYVRWDGLCH